MHGSSIVDSVSIYTTLTLFTFHNIDYFLAINLKTNECTATTTNILQSYVQMDAYTKKKRKVYLDRFSLLQHIRSYRLVVIAT